MTNNDFLQGISIVKNLLGTIQVPADENHVRIVGQIYSILNALYDDCANPSQAAPHKQEAAKK